MGINEAINESALAAWFSTDNGAVSVDYNGATIDAQVEIKAETDAEGSITNTGDLWVKRSDVAEPAYRDAVIIDGKTWRVRRLVDSDDWVHHVMIEHDERPQPFV